MANKYRVLDTRNTMLEMQNKNLDASIFARGSKITASDNKE